MLKLICPTIAITGPILEKSIKPVFTIFLMRRIMRLGYFISFFYSYNGKNPLFNYKNIPNQVPFLSWLLLLTVSYYAEYVLFLYCIWYVDNMNIRQWGITSNSIWSTLTNFGSHISVMWYANFWKAVNTLTPVFALVSRNSDASSLSANYKTYCQSIFHVYIRNINNIIVISHT